MALQAISKKLDALDGIMTVVNHLNEYFSDFHESVDTLISRLEGIEEKTELLEKALKRNNLVIFNLKETENSHYQLTKIVMDLFSKIVEAPVRLDELCNISRVGTFSFDRNRPVVVQFTSFFKKMETLQMAKKLQGTGIILTHDHTQKERERIKEIVTYKSYLTKKGKTVKLKGFDLLVDGVRFSLGDLQEKYQAKEAEIFLGSGSHKSPTDETMNSVKKKVTKLVNDGYSKAQPHSLPSLAEEASENSSKSTITKSSPNHNQNRKRRKKKKGKSH